LAPLVISSDCSLLNSVPAHSFSMLPSRPCLLASPGTPCDIPFWLTYGFRSSCPERSRSPFSLSLQDPRKIHQSLEALCVEPQVTSGYPLLSWHLSFYRGTSRRWWYPAEDTARSYAWFAFARVRATDWLASRLGPADPHLSTSLRFPPAHPLCRSTCLFPADQTIAYDQVARVNPITLTRL
jgi:hypothetical protein